jgi:hypothetical protein
MNIVERREILAEFWKDEDGRLWLNSMSVLAPYRFHDGTMGHSLTHYDVDWCKRDALYLFHASGGGGKLPQEVRGIYWRSEGFRVFERAAIWCNGDGDGIDYAKTKYIRMRNRTRRLKQLPAEFRNVEHFEWPVAGGRAVVTPGDLLDWLQQNGQQEDAVYCGECKDDLPGDDLCEHCWWCDTFGDYRTPTEPGICFSPDCWGCSRARRRRHEAYRDKKRRELWARRVSA